ncbi:MAG: hypothetical protein OSB10_09045 [Planctomycetota bacterium]|nr:hypothetical protein [Planctomycetota bacterium]
MVATFEVLVLRRSFFGASFSDWGALEELTSLRAMTLALAGASDVSDASRLAGAAFALTVAFLRARRGLAFLEAEAPRPSPKEEEELSVRF